MRHPLSLFFLALHHRPDALKLTLLQYAMHPSFNGVVVMGGSVTTGVDGSGSGSGSGGGFVVTGFSASWHAQQGSPEMSFVHLSHLKDLPCATQALMSLSSSHVGSVGAGVGVGVGAEVVVHGTGGIHVHLPSLAI